MQKVETWEPRLLIWICVQGLFMWERKKSNVKWTIRLNFASLQNLLAILTDICNCFTTFFPTNFKKQSNNLCKFSWQILRLRPMQASCGIHEVVLDYLGRLRKFNVCCVLLMQNAIEMTIKASAEETWIRWTYDFGRFWIAGQRETNFVCFEFCYSQSSMSNASLR